MAEFEEKQKQLVILYLLIHQLPRRDILAFGMELCRDLSEEFLHNLIIEIARVHQPELATDLENDSCDQCDDLEPPWFWPSPS